MQLDVAAFELQEGALGGGEQMGFGTGIEAAVGAGERDFLVRRGRRLAALMQGHKI
jgi:hypothetical protein